MAIRTPALSLGQNLNIAKKVDVVQEWAAAAFFALIFAAVKVFSFVATATIMTAFSVVAAAGMLFFVEYFWYVIAGALFLIIANWLSQ